MHSTPRLNTGTASSPSASSVSQHGPNSSCGTSPEPTNNSPTSIKPLNPINEERDSARKANGDEYVCKSGRLGDENETTFCEKLGMACGNPNNPIPKAPGHAVSTPPSNFDWLNQPSNNTFDPVLFNDYREPSASNGIGMSFFDDAFPMANFDSIGSPPLTSTAQAVVKDPVALCDAVVDGGDDDEEVMPADDMKQMLSCNKIWCAPFCHLEMCKRLILMVNWH